MKLRYKVVIANADGPTSSCSYPTYSRATRKFSDAVTSAACANVTRIELTEMRLDGGVTLHKEWNRGEAMSLRDRVTLKYGFKIHGFQTANGRARSANSEKFYPDYDAAREAAEGMCRRKNAATHGVVIYKAVQLVRPVQPQIEVEHIDL